MDEYNQWLDSSEMIAPHFNNPDALKITRLRTTKALFQKLLNNADNTKFKELHELINSCETPVIDISPEYITSMPELFASIAWNGEIFYKKWHKVLLNNRPHGLMLWGEKSIKDPVILLQLFEKPL